MALALENYSFLLPYSCIPQMCEDFNAEYQDYCNENQPNLLAEWILLGMFNYAAYRRKILPI